jgi:glycogen synthase
MTGSRKPEIFNADQGCQFTSQEFTGLLNDHEIQISMFSTVMFFLHVYEKLEMWNSLIRSAMGTDLSWKGLAQQYINFYRSMVRDKRKEGLTSVERNVKSLSESSQQSLGF